jgi:FAD/FMN-containing dehydrogenase
MVSHTGIAGLTLGGGLGWLVRRHGLSADNVEAVEIVTADGTQVTASATEHSDLFWALRGGGGNFGVVTSFEYRLHPVGPVVGGLVAYPLAEAASVVGGWRDAVGDAPDELMSVACFMTSPDGHALVGVAACHSGAPDAAERELRPLRHLGTVALDQLGPMRYADVQAMLDDLAVPGRRYYVRANYLAGVSDELVAVLAERHRHVPSPLSLMILYCLGGAAARLPVDATAFPYRDRLHYLEVYNAWTDPAEDGRNRAWLEETWAAVQPFLDRGVYVNHLDRGEGEGRVREAYGARTYERLAAIKAVYDPGNLFRLNQNIIPSAVSAPPTGS